MPETGLQTSEVTQCFPVVPADLVVHSWRTRGELAFGMEMAFEHRLNEHVLARASDLVLDAEPILGCRLVIDAVTPHWRRLSMAERNVFTLLSVSSEYEHVRHNGLDATKSAQAAVHLWRRDKGGDNLLIKMTHEVGDGGGLQYLASRLSSIYSALCDDDTHQPIPSSATDRDITAVLSDVPRREYPGVVWDLVRFLAPRWWPRRTLGLPLPTKSEKPWRSVIRRVSKSRGAFLSAYGKARGATLNDMFLAAAYRALAALGGWNGKSGLRIPITINLRRWCSSQRGLGVGPICNLSSFDCPFLGRDLGRDFDETLSNVSAVMAQRKGSRPGLALALLSRLWLQFHSPVALAREGGTISASRPTEGRGLTFSNEGPLDGNLLRFGSHAPVSAHILPPFMELPRLHFSLTGYNGVLTLSALTAHNGRATVESFFDALLDELPRAS